VRAAQDLLFHYQNVIEELRIVTGSKGIFDVTVDGEMIYSKAAEGRHAEPGEVLERFRARLPAGVREYGT
jgi:selT/selW/selH-like putative selenoprotein